MGININPDFDRVITLEDLFQCQDMLKYVSQKLNIMRWQVEEFDRTGGGPLYDRFGKGSEHEANRKDEYAEYESDHRIIPFPVASA